MRFSFSPRVSGLVSKRCRDDGAGRAAPSLLKEP
jgi:hypothetical protein